jgi:hypothetical protein
MPRDFAAVFAVMCDAFAAGAVVALLLIAGAEVLSWF